MKDIICHEPLDLNTFQFSHDKFSELIPEDSIVLDIGAHVGGFSIVFGSCVSKGKVLTSTDLVELRILFYCQEGT
jgi:23S rRNA U2552 (ribose-2'-O)-methylase RlmE/FtsJ